MLRLRRAGIRIDTVARLQDESTGGAAVAVEASLLARRRISRRRLLRRRGRGGGLSRYTRPTRCGNFPCCGGFSPRRWCCRTRRSA